MEKIDWSGRKYLVAQELGECIDMIFGQIQRDEKKWYLRSHSLSDGVGAFSDLLALEQKNLSHQPESQRIKKPSLFKRLSLLFKYLSSTRSITYKWKKRDETKRGAGPGVAFSLFTQEETIKLRALAKKQKVSLNSLLLFSLDQVVSSKLLWEPQERAWLIPVNMRGGVQVSNASANYTASMTLRFSGRPSMKALDAQLKSLYSSGIAWGSWIYSNITKFVGSKILKYLAKNYKSCWVGVFSNMGVWPLNKENDSVGDQEFWLAAPPVTSLCPVTSALLTWKGQLGITLQLHPSLASTEQEVEDLMEGWMLSLKELCEDKSELHPAMFSENWQGLEEEAQRF